MTWSFRPGSDDSRSQISNLNLRSQTRVGSKPIQRLKRSQNPNAASKQFETTNTIMKSNQPSHRRKPMAGFVGEHKSRETPDPIPNSEVKPGLPMILLRGKVGHRRLYGLRWVNPAK